MKKILALLCALTLIFSIASASYAAVTFGGYARVWYQSASDGTNSNNTFRFDHLALNFNADHAPGSGVFGNFQYYQVDKNSQASADIRLEALYYYHKNIFSEGDELDAGFIRLPFYNSAFKGIYIGTLAYYSRPKNSVGISYSGKAESFTYALAISNATNSKNINSNSEGIDTTIRLSYAVLERLKIGLGYSDDVINDSSKNSRLAFDVTYGIGPVDILAEYVSVTPQGADALTGIYFEGSYQITDSLAAYVGKTSSVANGSGKKLPEQVGVVLPAGPGGGNIAINDDWTVFGVKYQVSPKFVLQGEFLKEDSTSNQSFGLRGNFSL